MMDITEIMEYLPHRYPLLLVDKVLSLTENESIVAVKNVTINEPFFPGHFPHHPVMPGVLIIEAMAQAAAILAFRTAGRKPDADTVVYFAGIDNARFKKPVIPGDALHMHIRILRMMKGIWKFSAEARVEDKTVARAELMCTIREA
jgi:3-hydroxyacyl-[acyl-carrier-protein] dehydratase